MIRVPIVYKNLEVALMHDTKQGLLDYELQQCFKITVFQLNQNMIFLKDGSTQSFFYIFFKESPLPAKFRQIRKVPILSPSRKQVCAPIHDFR
jgi:hypothetical protein